MHAPEGLEVALDQGVVVVTIASGDGGNRVSQEMMGFLEGLLVSPPTSVGVLRIAAEGKAFCIGPRPPGPDGSIEELGQSIVALNRAFAATPIVTIAEVDGRAAGFGVGLACLADITIAGDAASFVCPEIEQRLSPALVLTWLSQLVGPKAAAWMALTGESLNAEQAADLGLVSRVVPSEDLGSEVDELVHRLRSFDRACLLEIKRFIRDRRGLALEAAESLAVERMTAWARTRAAG